MATGALGIHVPAAARDHSLQALRHLSAGAGSSLPALMAGGSRNRGGPKVGFPEGAAALHPSPRSARGPAAECPYTDFTNSLPMPDDGFPVLCYDNFESF